MKYVKLKKKTSFATFKVSLKTLESLKNLDITLHIFATDAY